MSIEHETHAFLNTNVSPLQALLRDRNLAHWNLATTGESRYADEVARLSTRLMTHLNQPDDWARICALYAQRDEIRDKHLRRRLTLAYQQYAHHQRSPSQISRIATLETELYRLFSTFRATLEGQQLTDNDIVQILRTERDSARRQAAWEAGKQIGTQAAPKIRELAALRNAAAQAQGWSDYYALSLALQEIDEQELFALLDTLEQQTRVPFLERKAAVDAVLAERFGLKPEELRPWHYSDPFFQKPPHTGEVDLDALFADQDIVALTLATCDALGLDVRDILARSDLYERPGKNQHAFCLHIDPLSDDVRVLANLRPDVKNMETCLHEFGHAIYDKYLGADLPFLLRKPAHISTTEAGAMMLGRLARDAAWLERVRGLTSAQVQHLRAAVQAAESSKQLIFVRWALVMVYFERDLYRFPELDLDQRWWEYVTRFQAVPCPTGRDAPDWATKIHLATSPVYYHNYILGELTASQLLDTIRRQTGATLVENPAAGEFLCAEIFARGATLSWNELLARVTGEPLTPRAYIADFVHRQG